MSDYIPQELALKLNYTANQMRTEIYKYGKTMYLTEAYKKGVEDAWKYAQMVCCNIVDGGLPLKDLISIFGDFAATEIIKLPFEEVKEKIDAYENKDEHKIVPGDLVKLTTDDYWDDDDLEKGSIGIVRSVLNENTILFTAVDGKVHSLSLKDVVYAGRHYPIIDEIFADLKELNNDTDN